MRREHGFFEESENGSPSRRPVARYMAAVLLLAGAACGSIATRLAWPDRNTPSLPLEASLQRAVEIRSNGAASVSELSAHHQNIVRRVRAGIEELVETARGTDRHAEWARSALALIRETARDPR